MPSQSSQRRAFPEAGIVLPEVVHPVPLIRGVGEICTLRTVGRGGIDAMVSLPGDGPAPVKHDLCHGGGHAAYGHSSLVGSAAIVLRTHAVEREILVPVVGDQWSHIGISAQVVKL